MCSKINNAPNSSGLAERALSLAALQGDEKDSECHYHSQPFIGLMLCQGNYFMGNGNVHM